MFLFPVGVDIAVDRIIMQTDITKVRIHTEYDAPSSNDEVFYLKTAVQTQTATPLSDDRNNPE